MIKIEQPGDCVLLVSYLLTLTIFIYGLTAPGRLMIYPLKGIRNCQVIERHNPVSVFCKLFIFVYGGACKQL
jgi:hypothetical protein